MKKTGHVVIEKIISLQACDYTYQEIYSLNVNFCVILLSILLQSVEACDTQKEMPEK